MAGEMASQMPVLLVVAISTLSMLTIYPYPQTVKWYQLLKMHGQMEEILQLHLLAGGRCY